MTSGREVEPDHAALNAVLESDDVRLEPFAEHHLELLRAACAEDRDIWEIYPVNMLGERFDEAMARFHQLENWVRFAVIDTRDGKVVGRSASADQRPRPRTGGSGPPLPATALRSVRSSTQLRLPSISAIASNGTQCKSGAYQTPV